MITLNDIEEARARFEGNVTETPLVWSQSFSRLTGRTSISRPSACSGPGRSRSGELNVLTRLDGKPVVAGSAGNHAQGVALAAAFTGSPCTIFMPETAPIPKVKATEDYGADVRLVGFSLADAVEAAVEHARQTGAHSSIPTTTRSSSRPGHPRARDPGAAPRNRNGGHPDRGRGASRGTALALKTLRPSVTVIGVEIGRPRSTPRADNAACWSETSPVAYPRSPTVCRIGPLRPRVGDHRRARRPHPRGQRRPDDSALAYVLDRSKIVVEAAGAVGVAALMEKLIPDDAPDPICIVLSGGNIDLMFLGKAVRHGLEAQGGSPSTRSGYPTNRATSPRCCRPSPARAATCSWSSIIGRASGSASAGWRSRSRSKPGTPTTPPASPSVEQYRG